MKITSRGYVRPKKGSKSSRDQQPPPQDQDTFMEALGRDFSPLSSTPPSRIPNESRGKLRRPPPHPFSNRDPFPSSPYGPGPSEEDGFAFMGMGPGAGYPFPPSHGPSPGTRGQYAERNSGENYVTIRSSDFADRETAAKYVSLLIKHGKESWVFRLPDEEEYSSRRGSRPANFEDRARR